MTTDFLITIGKDNIYKDIVRTIKPSDKINNRIIEKFTLEEEFFRRKYDDTNFDWGVVTEKEINRIKALNISNLKDSYNWNIVKGIKNNELRKMINYFKNTLLINNYDMEISIAKISDKYNYSYNESVNFLKFLIMRKELKCNLDEKLIKDFRYINIEL